ncbi:hydroxyacid dehydrogenase [Labilibaculum sp. DW002]|uniref:Hydroxyacid dehydrogenase n=1 Tax=Paralabilibaculum antarcticum TaxID=2912572 RepID=A0ABT5VUN0_9BACT|nr:NAD(P)-dependent oxidoreductase [Labilibaculum sp. DW002]MDE5418965.1 hydroxyacid dehydrogenase [Labilibaculum sp. DW002]
MKDKILVTYAIPKEGLSELEKYFELIYPKKEFFSDSDLIKLIPDCSALLSIFNRDISAEIINAGRKLKIISNYGVGFNNINTEAVNNNNIILCNTPDAVCEPTAELCLALMLSLSRQVSNCHFQLKTNPDFEWGVMKNLGNSLRGKTLGIIGLGKIGKSIAEKASVFGMKIIYHNRKPITDKKYEHYTFVEKDKLLEESDIVSLNCPLTPETHHLLSEKEFRKMKTSSLLINTARGSVIDEQALVRALKDKLISGAGLDVFENEPFIHSDLLKANNVVLVPHIGTSTIETRIEMGLEASENIISYLIKGIEKNRVN